MNDYDRALKEFLYPMINEKRMKLLEDNLENRTNYISVVLEDIYQPQNASAVLRTCDCFGIQDVHIVENRNSFEVNHEVELGAAQWLSLHYYNQASDNTETAIKNLKREGYRIVATTPHKNDQLISDFDLSQGKIAIMMGTEMHGLSKTAMDMADEYVKIPMAGFTESFNISVAAAIILYELNSKLRNSEISWKIEERNKEKILLQWMRNSINQIHLIESAFKKRYKS